MNAAEIRQLLKDAIAEFPERDEMLADLGLQRRHSHAPWWLAGVGLLGVGLGLGVYGEALARDVGLVRTKRSPLWATIGSALLGAGAGAGLFALVAGRVNREEEIEPRLEENERFAQAP